ncbi:MAG: LLM class flavin-dependent oxidoreductase [Candidatus Thermoplasmatota archaeon]|jgi:alkanesulfonate monooxygenase SsuD/methylene tetrahydromethanopterin reductase-like flavin-dependent oxidoreductase (luciferase family)
MEFDVFFSISQTPVQGDLPDEARMLRNFFSQVEAADRLGFGVAWIAESHLSSEVQKRNRDPVVPHWQGEVGLNCDMLQMAHAVFRRTKRIEVGSAVMNILCNGGPVAHAERIAFFLALHGLDRAERRRIHVGFSAGRFDFMNRAYGILPRSAVELALPHGLWKGKVFDEAAEIFARLLRGDMLNSEQVPLRTVTRADVRSDADWQRVLTAARADGVLSADGTTFTLPKRFVFEDLKLVPQEFRRDLLQLVVGSHDPGVQALVNRFMPAQVANLSITSPAVIDATHERMRKAFHKEGGPWKRSYMPRTVMVFLNEEPGLTPAQRTTAAQAEAKAALAQYWHALEGTLDPKKVEGATDNAVIGNAQDVAKQLAERYHPEDRLMLWFDFFNHDSPRVVRNMEAFMAKVAPRLQGKEVAA